MQIFLDALNSHQKLSARNTRSTEQVNALKKNIADDSFLSTDKNLGIYVVGSLGRKEIGKKSDLDIFAVSQNRLSRLDRIRFYSSIININKKMELPEFSNDGEFLKVFCYEEHERQIGSPRDDHENWFTARMLLLLESVPVHNELIYQEIAGKIIQFYFRDKKSASFSPIFFLNDLLRFWRTLCLNYESARSDNGNEKAGRKKNFNLKYSRRLTVFSTVLYLITKSKIDEAVLLELIKSHPLERLALALDKIGDDQLLSDFQEMLNNYEEFLNFKETESFDSNGKLNDIKKNSENFRRLFYKFLTHKEIEENLREYLVI